MRACENRVGERHYGLCGKEAHAYRKAYGEGVEWMCDRCAANELGMQGAFRRLPPEEELILQIMER